MDYEVLLEIGVSKEIIRVTKENLEGTVKSKLSGAVCGGPYLRPYDCVPKTKNTYILQRWSTQWDTFVDFNKDDDLKDGDKFRVSECKDQVVYMWYMYST